MKVNITRSASKNIKKLDINIQKQVYEKIIEIESLNTTNEIYSEKLSGAKNRYKIRVGNYRIVYEKITATHITATHIEITSVRDRKDIYNKLFGIVLSL